MFTKGRTFCIALSVMLLMMVGFASGSFAKTTITYWHGWTEQWEEMVIYVANEFNKLNPDIEVKEVVVPWGELPRKVLTAVAAGSPPDTVTYFGSIHIPNLVENNAVLAFDDYATPEEFATAKKWYHPMVWKLGEYKGKIYGLSYWQQCSALAWNKSTFEEVGLDPDKPPKTIEELDAYAERLTTYDARGNIDRMGFLPFQWPHIWHWGNAFGGKLYDDQKRKITANDPNLVKALDWMVSYSRKYDVKKIAAFESGLAGGRAGVLAPFIAGKFAMKIIGGPWVLGDYKKYGPQGFSYGIAPSPNPPGETRPATYTYGDLTVVPFGTKHPKEAWEFVKFTGGAGGNKEQYTKVLFWGGRPINVPVSVEMLDYPSMKEIVKEYPNYDLLNRLLLDPNTRVGIPPKTPVGTFYDQRLGAALDKARLLQKTPKEALDELSADVQAEQDKFFEIR